MRAAAEVEPLALLIDLDLLIFRNGVDQLDLEVLAHVAEGLLRLLARPHFLGEEFVAANDLLHLLFDDGQVFRRERLVAVEVVIEAVRDHRADGHLGARPQILHRFGEYVGGVVADQFQRAGILAVDEFDLGVALDRVVEIAQHAVKRHRHCALGQRRRDALGNIKACDADRVGPGGAVGKGEGDLGGIGRGLSARDAGVGHFGLLCSLAAYECR